MRKYLVDIPAGPHHHLTEVVYPDDDEGLLKCKQDTPDLSKITGSMPEGYTKLHARKWIRQQVNIGRLYGRPINFAIRERETGTLVGICGFIPEDATVGRFWFSGGGWPEWLKEQEVWEKSYHEKYGNDFTVANDVSLPSELPAIHTPFKIKDTPKREAKVMELGYWLSKPSRGKGIITQAVRNVGIYALKEMDLDKVEAFVLIENVASTNVCQRADWPRDLVMQRGVENWMWKKGDDPARRYIDDQIYGLTKDDLVKDENGYLGYAIKNQSYPPIPPIPTLPPPLKLETSWPFFVTHKDFIIRELKETDAKDVYQLCKEDHYLAKWAHGTPWPYQKFHAENYCKMASVLKSAAFDIPCLFAIESNGKLIGSVTLLPTGLGKIEWDPTKPITTTKNKAEVWWLAELGYWIGKDYRGKGLTTLAVQAMLQSINRGHLHTPLIRIQANVYPENQPSRSVLEKNGFQLEGVHRFKYGVDESKNTDCVVYARLVNQPRIAVIGAGAAGMICVKYLRDVGHFVDITAFERNERLGGTWIYREEHMNDVNSREPNPESKFSIGAIYEGLKTNIPAKIMEIKDTQLDTKEVFPDSDVILKYLEDYAKNNDLEKYVRLNSPVSKAWWNVETEQWHLLVNGKEQVFDKLSVCTGNYYYPLIPNLPGMDLFPGRILHSKDFRHSKDFTDKIVIVLGGGSSGIDITRLVAHDCKQAYSSVRAESDGVIGESAKDLTGKNKINVPIVKPPIKALYADGSVEFEDGSKVPHVDAIILATGFLYKFPFFEEDVGQGPSKHPLSSEQFQAGQEYQELIGNGLCINGLWIQVVYARNPSLCFVGLPMRTIPFPLFEFQSALVAALWKGQVIPATPEEALKEELQWIERLNGEFGFGVKGVNDRKKHLMGMAQWPYCDEIAALTGNIEPTESWRIDLRKNVLKLRKEHLDY